MKELIFLTSEDLLDVDMPVVKEINSSYSHQFNVTWIIVLRMYGWFSEDELVSFCNDNRIKYKILIQKEKLKNPLNILFYLKLLRIIKSYNPDIIYESYWGVPFMHLLRWIFLKKNKFVIAVHDVVEHYKMDNAYIRTFYYSFLIQTYQNFHIFSKSQLKIFNERFQNKRSFYSPLCLKNFGTSEGVPTKDKSITNFLFFGIIRPNKGLDLIIEAANRLGEKNNNFHIVIAGKCDDWKQYASLIKHSKHFTCKIRNIEKIEVPTLFNETHFLLLPYRDVTQSGVLLSAYNYRVPAIASKLEWFEEYINDNVNGYLFESQNIDELVISMETAINLNQEKYEQITRQLDKFITDEISVKRITKNYADFFQNI